MSAVWRNFGRSCCRYLRDADILHVRSGRGKGGVIAARAAQLIRLLLQEPVQRLLNGRPDNLVHMAPNLLPVDPTPIRNHPHIRLVYSIRRGSPLVLDRDL